MNVMIKAPKNGGITIDFAAKKRFEFLDDYWG